MSNRERSEVRRRKGTPERVPSPSPPGYFALSGVKLDATGGETVGDVSAGEGYADAAAGREPEPDEEGPATSSFTPTDAGAFLRRVPDRSVCESLDIARCYEEHGSGSRFCETMLETLVFGENRKRSRNRPPEPPGKSTSLVGLNLPPTVNSSLINRAKIKQELHI